MAGPSGAKQWLAFAGWFLFRWLVLNLFVFAGIGALNLLKVIWVGRLTIAIPFTLLVLSFLLVNLAYVGGSLFELVHIHWFPREWHPKKLTGKFFRAALLVLLIILVTTILIYLVR